MSSPPRGIPSSSRDIIKKSLPLIRAGELWKKGGKRQNWKKRWFELRSHSLAYFATRKVFSVSYLIINQKEYIFLTYSLVSVTKR